MSIFSKPSEQEPYAEVKQIDRKTWLIYIVIHSGMRYGPYDYGWTRRSKSAAEKKATKELARYNRKYGKLDAGFTIQ